MDLAFFGCVLFVGRLVAQLPYSQETFEPIMSKFVDVAEGEYGQTPGKRRPLYAIAYKCFVLVGGCHGLCWLVSKV